MSLREEAMKPCGIITTIIIWKKIKELPFNIALFVFQIVFMVVGKIYGKVEVKWGQMWQAAKVSHVRLVLEPITTAEGISDRFFRTMSFGWPKAVIEIWDTDWNDGKRFKYYDRTFEPSPEFVEAMIEYAEDQVGKRYDWLQLILGYPANLLVWLFWPPWWGKEKIRWFNLRGALEVCSSGWAATLRWAEVRQDCSDTTTARVFENKTCDLPTMFFKGYSTAVIPPCLVPLSKNWREREK